MWHTFVHLSLPLTAAFTVIYLWIFLDCISIILELKSFTSCIFTPRRQRECWQQPGTGWCAEWNGFEHTWSYTTSKSQHEARKPPASSSSSCGRNSLVDCTRLAERVAAGEDRGCCWSELICSCSGCTMVMASCFIPPRQPLIHSDSPFPHSCAPESTEKEARWAGKCICQYNFPSLEALFTIFSWSLGMTYFSVCFGKKMLSALSWEFFICTNNLPFSCFVWEWNLKFGWLSWWEINTKETFNNNSVC